MQVIVCGGRDYDNRALVYKILDRLYAANPNMTLIQGGARGADRLAKEWANERGVPQQEVPAQWDLHGKRAGYLRNVQMANMLDKTRDGVIAFPGGKGTQHMIDIAQAKGISVHVVNS
jgi:hypothetical protein